MAPATKLCIAPVGEALPICSPDLMPFHIDYSGPAPISTYMHVEPAKEVVGAPYLTPKSRSGVENNASTSSIKEDEEKCAEGTQKAEDNASQTPNETIRSAAGRRFVSTFRGREIHGLDINIPNGYTGLVLRTDEQALVGSSSLPSRERREDTVVKRITRKSKVLVTKDESGEIDLEMSEKVVQEVEMMDLTEETEDTQYPAEDEDEYLPKRILVPSAQFNSFRLWNADIPADDGADEYTRSLTEWITLAHHIHQIPP